MRRDLAIRKAAEIAAMRDLVARGEASARMVGGWALESQAAAVAFQEMRLAVATWLITATEDEIRLRRDGLRALVTPLVLARKQGDITGLPVDHIQHLALVELMDMVLEEL